MLDPKAFYRVHKMEFPKGQKARDRPDTIRYNVTVSGIPPQAYDYIINGKSALCRGVSNCWPRLPNRCSSIAQKPA